MIWVISGGNSGWKSSGISTRLQNLPLFIKVWQSRMQLRLLLFADNLLISSGFLLISSWISTMSGFWNNTKIVSWFPPMVESVFLMITRSNLVEGVHPPPPKSWLLHMVWSWNLYPQYFLTKDVDWRRHYFGHVTHMYFTDQKTIFAEVSINEKWHHQWTCFIKGSYWWKIQVDTTTRSQDIAWSLIFPIMLGL